ncbi:MAG: alkaline phosphatase family protein [Planctomycetota bacterium]|jgi:predicted AlkP superfamily phosphohydrolase/phosphomutase
MSESKQVQKAVVIGIDGLPYSLVQAYIQSGVMSQFGQIVQEGSLMQMKSSLPEVSSVAWTNFMTGKNPGEHGIFGFMELDDRYGYTFPNYTNIQAPTFWEKLNLPSIIINVPETYPAVRPLNGLLISGFVAIDLKKAVYPKGISEKLEKMGYRLDVKAKLAAEDPDAFFEDLFEVFEKRVEAIKYFFDSEKWQIFVGMITATDRLHHYFFSQALNHGPYHQMILEFYRKLDTFISDMFQRAKDQGALFLTCSDHGFVPIKTEVYINRWLIENGYLELENGKNSLAGVTKDSKVFCLDPGRIYIHSRGNFARGCVTESEHEALISELKDKLAQISYNGNKIVKKIYHRNEIFRGPYSDYGPDLHLLPHDGFDLKGAVNRNQLFDRTHFTGMHTYDNAHIFIFPKQNIVNPRIEQIAPLIEEHFKEQS